MIRIVESIGFFKYLIKFFTSLLGESSPLVKNLGFLIIIIFKSSKRGTVIASSIIWDKGVISISYFIIVVSIFLKL